MKISKMIKKLQEIQSTNGDIDVVVPKHYPDGDFEGYFYVELSVRPVEYCSEEDIWEIDNVVICH